MSTPPVDLDVWVLAGQSNMQGCGLLQSSLEPDERVWNFSSAGQWEAATEPLHRLWESCTRVHQNFLRAGLDESDRDLSNEELAVRDAESRVAGAGLGLAFGKAMADATGQPVGLVSAAHGGTTLEDWNFNRKDQGGDSLYGAMLHRIKQAGGNLRGVLWYQGESDCTEGACGTYSARFAAWVQALRNDLNRPDLPIITVQLSRVIQPIMENPAQGWQPDAWEQLREAQRLLPGQLPNTAVVSAIDLGLCDTIHIDTPGLIRLGKRMARLAVPMQGGSAPIAPRLEKLTAGNSPHGFGVVRVLCEGVTGGWRPRHHISGFEVRTPEGNPHPSTLVIGADADEFEPHVINATLSTPIDDSVHLGYGLGLNPYCNAVDEADMPLPAFSAQPIMP